MLQGQDAVNLRVLKKDCKGLIYSSRYGILLLEGNKNKEDFMAKLKFQKVVLNVSFYREGDKFIAYNPALNLSTCGDTMEQAKKRFEEALSCFLEETDKMGTMDDVLLECGWKKIDHPQKHWQPPIFVGQDYEEIKVPCPA